MRSRGSITGPLILITLGVLFLMRSVWPAFSMWDLLAHYWPYLLIVWGVLQLVEISIRAWQNTDVPPNGISGGAWFLILLICLGGFGLFEARGPDTWWRRASFDQGMDWFGEAHDYTVPLVTKSSGKSPHIIIENFRGNAKITGSDGTDVQLMGHKTVRALKQADADGANNTTPVELVSDGSNLIVRCNQSNASNNVRVSTDLELTVPHGASLEANGRLGDFDVNQLDGDVEIVSENAGIRMQDVNGNVRVDTRKGDIIRCLNVKGSVELKGHGTDVELEKIGGPVTVNGTYPGTITLKDLSKPLHLDNFSTSLTVQRVIGQITMDRGSFSAQNIAGPSQLNTRATDVDVTGFTDPLDITVEKGDISLRPGAGTLARMGIRTRSGNIDLVLPDAAKFELKATTDRGDINNEFGSPLKLESDGRNATLLGAVGAGPTLNLTTDRGSITVRKGNGSDVPPARAANSEAADRDDEANSNTHSLKPPMPPKPPAPPKPPVPSKPSSVEL